MTKTDRKRLSRLIDLVGKTADAIGDAQMRGIIGNWKSSTGGSLQEDLNEFHDWHLKKLDAPEGS